MVIIHGGMGREDRVKAQESFKHDPEVRVLLATDAAGEGINLQRAHLMVNYDLPWNPNRLEQRFGRIHRIGQTEVCHLWNLVADETREGDVYRKLLEKLEEARKALGGHVFDVLGKLQFEGRSLRELLIEAIRYGDQADVRARLTTVLEHALDRGQLRDLLEERALAHDAMDASRVHRIREDMERAEARRLQPHYIESFFHEAFRLLGGSAKQRETAPLRGHPRPGPGAQPRPPDRHRRAGAAPLRAHRLREVAGGAARASRWPPSSARVIRYSTRSSTSPSNATATCSSAARCWWTSATPGPGRACCSTIEHTIQDASLTRSGERRVVSKRMLYVELDADGHDAPHALRALPRLPAAGRGRTGRGGDPRSARVRLDRPRDREEGAGLRDRPGRAGAPQGSARRQAQAHRQDRSRGEGSADQGDHLLGPPRRAAQTPGESRQVQRQAQLGRGPQTGR